MPSNTITNTYGLLLRTVSRYGNDYLVAEIVKREGDHSAPRNCTDNRYTSDDRPKHLAGLALEGLRIEGWMIYDYGAPHLVGIEPSYYDLHAIDENLAIRMARTLKRINQRIEDDAARDPVDVITSLCAALRLSFIVECSHCTGDSSYDNNRWHWMSVGEGRNRYRQMIDRLAHAKDAAVA